MIYKYKATEEAEFFNVRLAKWVLGVLAMLIEVVGPESLVGLILRRTCSEIASLVRDEESEAGDPRGAWFGRN
jgi:hypothetical protein